jgi:hypothetical protein
MGNATVSATKWNSNETEIFYKCKLVNKILKQKNNRMYLSKKIIPGLLVTFSLVTVCACKKNSTGGKAEIHAIISHGSTPVIGTTTLYVKFDAKSQPADPVSTYDLKVMGEPDDNHVHVEDLRPGNYYLYAVAFDSTAMLPVKGGAAATIKWGERKKTKEVHIQAS